MRKPLNGTMSFGARVLILAFVVEANLLLSTPIRAAGCGCMDVALVVDTTGSMTGALSSVKAELSNIVAVAQFASGGDLRMGLVTTPADNVEVNQPFTTVIANLQNQIQRLAAGSAIGGGSNEPESTDAALQLVVTGSADPSCTVSNAPFGAFRPGCVKIAVVITDAHPGGCHDSFTPGVDDVHAHNVAVAAASVGIRITAIYVPTTQSGGEQPDIKAIMEDYANTSGGGFVEAAGDGTGTGDGIADSIALCGGAGSGLCVTRTASFWFTHPYSAQTNCLNLLTAIQANGGFLDVGFLRMPTTFHDADSSLTATDTLMEALGFYWKATGQTGENGGSQNQKLGASKLCKLRKQLAVELIAATANVRLFGTDPANCTIDGRITSTNQFPHGLISQARAAARGLDPVACQTMTLLLRKFNKSGIANHLENGFDECTPIPSKITKGISRDPTTQVSCPGLNNSCNTAEAIVFSADAFASASFSRTISLPSFPASITTNAIPIPTCGTGGAGAMWKIMPGVGAANRPFTADTFGSCDTLLQVWSGPSCTNLFPVICNDNVPPYVQSRVQFTTDGINTFYIAAQAAHGATGRLKLHVTSP